MKPWTRWIAAAAAGLVLLAVAAYVFILPGLSVARQEPSRAEVVIATWLLHQSVPRAAKAAINPLGPHPGSGCDHGGTGSVQAEMRGVPRL